MHTPALVLFATLAWWPYPPVDACPQVLAVLDSGPAASSAIDRLKELGATAVPFLIDGLGSRPDTPGAIVLLDLLAHHRDARAHAAILPYLFHPDPEVAALATRTLSVTTGARAQPTLEHRLSVPLSFAEGLAAIEGLREAGLESSFGTLARFVADSSHDPILRGLALDAMVELNPRESARWLDRLPATTRADHWLSPRVEELKMKVAETRRSR